MSRRLLIGDVIRRQRQLRRLSVRKFAEVVGISNPYLSQIERGLRVPSDRVVEAMARSLAMSADDLYALAGITADDDSPPCTVPAAIEADPALTSPQRKALLNVYHAFVATGRLHGQREQS